MSGADNKAVFLSYASQDAAAALRIAEALRAAGIEVWFDQDELVGGDAWDKKIRQQIKECAIFVPVISANTQARPEGYFRLEWLLAVERSRLMSDDHPFLFPVVIDDTADAAARVPDRFRDVQWTRLNVKDTPESLAARVAKILGHNLAGVADPSPASARPATTHTPGEKRFGDPWMRRAGVIFGLLIALIYATRPLWKSAAPHETPSPAAAQPAQSAPLSEARQLTAKARALYDALDSSHDDYKFAEELLAQAKTKDSMDAEVWATEAQLHERYLSRGWDVSDARREAARAAVQRAIRLDPQSFEARFAQSGLSADSGGDAREKERLLRELRRERPTDQRVLRALAAVLERTGRLEESVTVADESAALPGGDPLALYSKSLGYWFIGQTVDAEAAIQASLAQRSFASPLMIAAWYRVVLHGDADGARAYLQRIKPAELIEDRAAFIAFYVELLAHRPDAAIARLQAVPRDWLNDFWYRGPKSALIGQALELGGRHDAAGVEWTIALKLVEQRLTASPNNADLLYNRTRLLGWLGRREEAEREFALMRQLSRADMGMESAVWKTKLYAQLGHPAEALQMIAAGLQHERHLAAFPSGVLRLDPIYDPLRSEPEFVKLVTEAEALERSTTLTESKASQPVTIAIKSDEKSVAVLAFDNRSDDKDAEYFSDGISEELINVLGRVPGLTVKGRTSAFFFKGKNATAQEIAEKLGVNYLVRGSVRKANGKVRITAQLSRAATDEIMWSSESLERDLKDLFAVQDEIAGLIAKNLSLKLGASSAAVTTAVNPQAFELYLQGREAWNRRTRDGYDRAEALFTKAVELDANFARAYSGLADVLDLRAIDNGEIGRWSQRNAEVFVKMHSLLDKALALDPQSAEVQASLGDAFFDEWKPAESIAALRRSVELNPNYATGWHWLGEALADRGEIEEALTCMRRAVELEPFSLAILVQYSRCCRMAGRMGDALEFGSRALYLHADAPRALASHAMTLIDLGRTAEALPLVRTLLQTDAGRDWWQTGMVVVRTGLKTESDELLARYRRADRVQLIAPLLAARGNKEEFLEVWQRFPMMTSEPWYLWEPFGDYLRKEPGFLRVLEQAGLTEAHARAQAWRAAHPPEKISTK